MDASSKNQATRDDKRTAILQAAWKLIRHYGYNKTTVEEIAQAAGIGKGTVYLHFASKKDVMLGLVDLTNDRILKDIEQIACREGSPESRLKDCLLHRVMTLYDLVQKYPHSDDVIASLLPEIVTRLGGHVKRHGEILAEIVEEGVRAGQLATADSAITGQLLATMFELLTPPHYRFPSRNSLERFAGDALELTLNGLRARR